MFSQSPLVGPGSESLVSHTFEILILLGVAFILGYLLSYFFHKINISNLQHEIEKLKNDLTISNKSKSELSMQFNKANSDYLEFKKKYDEISLNFSCEKTKADNLAIELKQQGNNKRELELQLGNANSMLTELRNTNNNENNIEENHQLKHIDELQDTKISEYQKNFDEMNVLREKFADSQKQIAILNDKNNICQQQITQINQQNNNVFTEHLLEISRLQGEISVLKEKLNDNSYVLPKIQSLLPVKGIGPKINALLHANGIMNFADLAATSVERLHEILIIGGDNYIIHDPSTWPYQAKLIHEGKEEEFNEYTKHIDAGKIIHS